MIKSSNVKLIPDQSVLKQFSLCGSAKLLPKGEGRSYRVGNAVVKHINQDSAESSVWIADLFHRIRENNFRVARPIACDSGQWITPDGWSAWTFLEGTSHYADHIPAIITAVKEFHQALRHIPRPVFLNQDSPYQRADEATWGEPPQHLPVTVASLVEPLYELRQPFTGQEDQLIHGDLNPDNILIVPGQAPAIIDIAPYWHPLEFALAVFAYWIGPWKNDLKVLKCFSSINHFKQMLIRAAIRMPLISYELKRAEDNERYRQATKLIIQYVKN